MARRAPWWAFVADVVLVLAFVVIGRRSHDENDVVAGIWTTAWPFLSGMAIGWIVVLVARWRLPALRSGIVVWIATVLFGMLLRVVSGQGIAVSFVIVALIVLGVFLLGWRGIVLGALRNAKNRRMRGSRA
ncbi:DUF3054 domain-containing protein [Frondihabitans cladoniiphilus]|uniref:DUF3054 family protein n=1 Tax=Frondihabitans cladoniiphilus TaxID=715785 RepID=A0ABP8VTE6_9MICO